MSRARRKPNLSFEPDDSEVFVTESGSWTFKSRDGIVSFNRQCDADIAQGEWRIANGFSRYTGERI